LISAAPSEIDAERSLGQTWLSKYLS